MRSVFFLFLLFGAYSFSQTEIISPILKLDNILEYDIEFEESLEENIKIELDNVFDAERVKERIDSLNRLTPLNLVYNQTVLQHIKFYLFQRPEQISKLLALSEYNFPS